MGERTAMIRARMDQTRASLASRLGELEESLLDPVKQVVETTSDTVESVGESVEAVSDAVQDSVESARHLLDLPQQVRRHPWVVVGIAAAAGFVGERILERATRRRHPAEPPAPPAPAVPTPPAAESSPRTPESATEQQPSSPKEESWLHELGKLFGGEIDQLKALALGAAFGAVRDLVVRSAPEALETPLTGVMDDITSKLGGEPVEGPLVEPSESKTRSKGDKHVECDESKMGRPVGAAHRQGQEPVGQSHR